MTSESTLGPLEMQVLGLFQAGAAKSVAEVQAALAEAGHDAAYTTVMTVLSRLCEKGVLSRERDGKRYLYTLSRVAPARASRMVERIHRALFNTVRTRPIAALLERDELSTDELRALKRLVEAKLAERKR